MKVSVIVFPGTNCDHDIEHLYKNILKAKVHILWHQETDLKKPDLVVIPGGFSHGDYLRCGALAKISPIMKSVAEYASQGGNVLGICNGFQILCESGLLPGVLLQNKSQTFVSRFVSIKVCKNISFFTNSVKDEEIIHCPVAHFEGNYFTDIDTLKEIEDNQQVVFRYCDFNGKVEDTNPEINFNGSINSIAGVCNREGNVVGLMPHPERAVEKSVGWIAQDSGLKLFLR